MKAEPNDAGGHRRSKAPSLTHVQVQMARELGINPKKLGKPDHHEQEPWKMTLSEDIEHIYLRGSESLLAMTLCPSRSKARQARLVSTPNILN